MTHRPSPAAFDELYAYDNMQRLLDMDRGDLNAGHDTITNPTWEQAWTLDPTGNWKGFTQEAPSTSDDLVQTRASNELNQITDITETVGTAWATPACDRAGNMTTMPRPGSLDLAYGATYDAWNRLVELIEEPATLPFHPHFAVSLLRRSQPFG